VLDNLSLSEDQMLHVKYGNMVSISVHFSHAEKKNEKKNERKEHCVHRDQTLLHAEMRWIL
jgi:phage head maturation protease